MSARNVIATLESFAEAEPVAAALLAFSTTLNLACVASALWAAWVR